MKTIPVYLFACFAVVALSDHLNAQTKFAGTTMGPIEYNVVVHDSIQDKQSIQSGIQQRLDEINDLMSTYIDSSDVSRLNQAGADVWVEVDPLTFSVVKRAIELSELTGGAFDMTVGPAVNHWKFGPNSEQRSTSVTELREFVGYRLIETRETPPAIRKRDARTRIDLSAIAKGFAVDHVAEWLQERGLENFMVEVGGEVSARGKTPKGRWRVGIERPSEIQRSVATIALLKNMAMATSGDYRNFRIEDGKRISHVIDPNTCEPVEDSIASISIVVDDCMTADGIATAVMVMGKDKGKEFCRTNGIEYVMMERTDTNSTGFLLTNSNSFPQEMVLVSQNDDQSIWPAFIGAVVVFSLAIGGMAVGAVFNNKPIKGSCGGIAAVQNEDGSSNCSMCQKPVADCPEQAEQTSNA